ncbi:protein-tyrosine phosphatase family protein [Singulisphaera sp. PoT]|uniref:protein-tyrosine phosphatase family protein n=1 Tax=Singulisphaera sp. PoT TaxID=3411797 RepID=UPI003BF4807B
MTRRRLRSWFREYGLGVATFGVMLAGLAQSVVVEHWFDWFEKRVRIVAPGQLVRGAFQRPEALRRIIKREGIKTIVTLTAYSETDDRFLGQIPVVQETGVRWMIVPVIGSRPSIEQMRKASDLLNEQALRPIFFHCVAGHHRTSLALAAYRMRHEGWSADRAWAEVSSLPWADPEADKFDRKQIYAFAEQYGARLAGTPGTSPVR